MEQLIAMNSNSYHGFSIEAAIAGTKRAGFSTIELTATQGWTEHVFRTMSFDRLCEIRELLEREELSVVGMSGHTNLMDADRLDDFKRNIQLAAFFKAPHIISSIGEAHLEDSVEGDNRLVADHIRSIVPLLEKYGVSLALEVHGKHGTGTAIGQIVQLVDSPLVSIAYDTANVIFYGNVDPAEDLASCVDQVGYMHLKDKQGLPQEWNFPALGEGLVDFPGIFQVLKQAGKVVPWSIEIEFTSSGAGDVDEVDRAAVQSAEYLKRLGCTV